MNGTRWIVWMWLAVAPVALADETTKVAWHRDVANAWKATRQHGRPLLVFVTREDCFYCTQMNRRTYSNLTVAGAIHQSFVPLVLDGGTPCPLLEDLHVTAYPCTFVISAQAVILDRIEGFVAPEVLANRLNALRPQVPVAKVAKEP